MKPWDGRPETDSGWITLTPASGITGPIRARKLNGVPFFDGIASGTFGTGSVITIVAPGGLPPAMRPSSRANAQASGSSQASSVRIYVEANGGIYAVTGPTAPAYIAMAGLSATYLPDNVLATFPAQI